MGFIKLIEWSRTEFHHLPWRKERSLYRTLVSEIMLQQTTVSTVRNHFERFLLVFPDLESLVKASEQELLIAWKGLGYYRRAKNLKKIAHALVENHRGTFPTDEETLQSIPGIGPYTANALISIGMDRPGLAVDANLERVLSRIFGFKAAKGIKLQKEIQGQFKAGKIFKNKISFRDLNEALMDLGRTYCQARKASCELCVMKKECHAYLNGTPLAFPLETKSVGKKVEHELHLLRVFVFKKEKLMVYKKGPKEWLSGQHEVPTFALETSDPKLEQYPSLKMKKKLFVADYKTGITKYKIRNSILIMDEGEFKALGHKGDFKWVKPHEAEANLSTATMKGLQHILLKKREVSSSK